MRKQFHSLTQDFWRGLFRVLYGFEARIHVLAIKAYNHIDYINYVETDTVNDRKYHRSRRWRN